MMVHCSGNRCSELYDNWKSLDQGKPNDCTEKIVQDNKIEFSLAI